MHIPQSGQVRPSPQYLSLHSHAVSLLLVLGMPFSSHTAFMLPSDSSLPLLHSPCDREDVEGHAVVPFYLPCCHLFEKKFQASALPCRPITTFLPLAIVLGVSMFKEALEDIQRFQADREVNKRGVLVFNPVTNAWVRKQWRDIVVRLQHLLAVQHDTPPCNAWVAWEGFMMQRASLHTMPKGGRGKATCLTGCAGG